jgi:hypothetical protein
MQEYRLDPAAADDAVIAVIDYRAGPLSIGQAQQVTRALASVPVAEAPPGWGEKGTVPPLGVMPAKNYACGPFSQPALTEPGATAVPHSRQTQNTAQPGQASLERFRWGPGQRRPQISDVGRARISSLPIALRA